MKTVEEKVTEFMHRNAPLLAHLSGADLDAIRHSVKIAIKEQDRDTRHECAEAVNSMQLVVSQCPTVDYCVGFNKACMDAHNVCMNVKAL